MAKDDAFHFAAAAKSHIGFDVPAHRAGQECFPVAVPQRFLPGSDRLINGIKNISERRLHGKAAHHILVSGSAAKKRLAQPRYFFSVCRLRENLRYLLVKRLRRIKIVTMREQEAPSGNPEKVMRIDHAKLRLR